MKETKDLVGKISTRLTEVRKEQLEFLWSDFLGAVEKVVNKLSNEELTMTNSITIFYETKEGDEHVYRSKIAGVDGPELDVVYEENSVPLGTKSALENSFQDFKKRADKDKYCQAACWFDTKKLFDYAGSQTVMIDFNISKINIDIKETQSEYKLISE